MPCVWCRCTPQTDPEYGSHWFFIEYSDGDKEELTWSQLKEALILKAAEDAKAPKASEPADEAKRKAGRPAGTTKEVMDARRKLEAGGQRPGPVAAVVTQPAER